MGMNANILRGLMLPQNIQKITKQTVGNLENSSETTRGGTTQEASSYRTFKSPADLRRFTGNGGGEDGEVFFVDNDGPGRGFYKKENGRLVYTKVHII